ncbi:MAG: sortase [Patescibacteria group bacterium]
MPKAKRKTNKFSQSNRTSKQQMNFSFAVFVAWILILWGSFYFVRKFFWQSYTRVKVLQNEDSFVTEVSFPSLNINRDVVTTHVKNGEWLLVDAAANYVYESARPGDVGPVIIYGHNTPAVFGQLTQLVVGQDIIVKTASGQKFYYLVTAKKVVDPDEVGLLESNKETLIIYTCTGFLDSKRLVIIAKPLF